MKKYIYGILLVLGLIAFASVNKANAATYTFHMSSGVNDSGYSISSPTDLYMSGDYILAAYTANNGHLYVILNHGYDTSFYGTNKDNSRRDVHFVGYSVQRMYYYAIAGSNFSSLGNGLYSLPIQSNATVTGVTSSSAPFFNNQADAKNYALGQAYNSSNIIGGTVPISYSYNSSQDYRTVVDNAVFMFTYQKYKITLPYELLHFETVTDLQAGYGVTFSGNVPSNAMKRIVTFNFSVPTRQSFLDNYGSYFDVNGTGTVLAAQLKNLVGGFVDEPANNKSRWINNMEYHNLSVSVDVPLTDNSLVFIESLTSANARVRDAISNYYSGSVASAFVVENLFARLHSVEAHLVGYDAAANKYVAYPSGYYLLDQFYYDGTYHKKLGFSINDESSVPNGSSLTEQQFNNIGNESNYPSIPGSINQAISDQLTNDINNTGDNVINNYIDGVNNSWKDFTDGELNVDDQISDVYSILKSISHIGVLFGLLFNGFFPPVVITLIGFAVLLIPIIIIIKLIK